VIYFLKVEGLEQLQRVIRLQREYTKIRFGLFIEFPLLSSINKLRDNTFRLALKKLKGYPKIVQVDTFYVETKAILKIVQDCIFIEADYILPSESYSFGSFLEVLATFKTIMKMLNADIQLLLPYSELEDYKIDERFTLDNWESVFFEPDENITISIPYIQSNKIKHTIKRWKSIKNLLKTHPDKKWIIFDFNRYYIENIQLLKENKVFGIISRNWVRRHLWYEQKVFPTFRQKVSDYF